MVGGQQLSSCCGHPDRSGNVYLQDGNRNLGPDRYGCEQVINRAVIHGIYVIHIAGGYGSQLFTEALPVLIGEQFGAALAGGADEQYVFLFMARFADAP